MNTLSMDVTAMQIAAKRACDLMKVLSNPDRLLICCQLSTQEMCVAELALTLGIVQPTLSQQLSVLRRAGLVNTRREGKNIFYQMATGPALAVMGTLFEQYCKAPPTKTKRKTP